MTCVRLDGAYRPGRTYYGTYHVSFKLATHYNLIFIISPVNQKATIDKHKLNIWSRSPNLVKGLINTKALANCCKLFNTPGNQMPYRGQSSYLICTDIVHHATSPNFTSINDGVNSSLRMLMLTHMQINDKHMTCHFQ